MQEFSFNALMALVWANKLISSAVLSTLLAIIAIKIYWEQVAYFVMRAWHGLPLIGTVARLARKNTSTDDHKWLLSETSLCNDYYHYYQDVGEKNADYYNKCGAYLDAIGESDRRERPLWVLVLVFLLILFEAVGFAYVLVPFINQNLSSNDQTYLGWMAAFLLSIISAGFAEAAGRAIHHNTLVSKARHWWESDPERGNQALKQQRVIRIDETYSDADAKDYNRILNRLNTNHTVTPKRGWIIGCALVVLIMACAAFGIRAYQLKSIETEMVGNPDVFAQQSAETSASPFELPDDSAALNQQASDSTLTDKMDAIRSASLITFVVLSVIYIAIQAVSVWLASIFGFAGIKSKEAWEYTHKFNNAAELERWMETQRIRISAHADHKLRMLQLKLSRRPTTDPDVAVAISGAQSRDFNAYVRRKQADTTHRSRASEAPQIARPAPLAAQSVQALATAPQQQSLPEPAPAPVQPVEQPVAAAVATPLDALRNKDLTIYSEEQLRKVCQTKGYDEVAVLALRAEQQVLKDFEGV
ncbi:MULTISPECIES: hypothetical protein [unclassified Pseudomonas]|uniref:hypothetical protein n=1 Tax=unclassified Pseudomonas TaxID=196821 RepID=UPI0021BB1B46|nr:MULTISPECIES: hypothetical protein [unclassified Pseudomonas]MCT8166721.1 hypothetical protein [Pseudomonas sp. HD6422]MCT8185588.1 hypothetical protein [Pseudomonas sp. HD6421]